MIGRPNIALEEECLSLSLPCRSRRLTRIWECDSRCGHTWLACLCSVNPFALHGRQSPRLRRPVQRRIGLKPSPPFGSEPQGRRQPSQCSRPCPTSLGSIQCSSVLKVSTRRSDKRGCEGRLRSSPSSKLRHTGRRRRRLFSAANAEGPHVVKQGSQQLPHRTRLPIYEPTPSIGTETVTDKESFISLRAHLRALCVSSAAGGKSYFRGLKANARNS